MLYSIIYFLSLFVSFIQCYKSNEILSCYYKWNEPPLKVLDVTLCTHIIMIGEAQLDRLGHFQRPSKEISQAFSSFGKANPTTKIMHSLVGENDAFSELVSKPEVILKFANESHTYLREFGFHGLDLDWEFPVWSSGKKSDKAGLTQLLKGMREAYGDDLLISLAVSGPPTISRIAYDTAGLNKYADFVQVMNYDFHVYSWLNPVTGFNAPLHRMKGEIGVIGQMNSEASMLVWGALGLWKNKTVFGMPIYNQAFVLFNWRIHKPFSLAEGMIDEYATHSDFCFLLQNHTYVWNEKAASPYLYGSDKLWLSGEDERSVREKTEFAKSLNIAGVMVFAIGSDDVFGFCKNGTYPLLNTIKTTLNSSTKMKETNKTSLNL